MFDPLGFAKKSWTEIGITLGAVIIGVTVAVYIAFPVIKMFIENMKP